MTIAFITTVLNEEKTIRNFLDSLFSQTLLPDEIIISDGGSKDLTKEIIQSYFARNKNISCKLIVKKGNRSVGRNEAIRQANSEIILCSDAGCILDKDWSKNLAVKFRRKDVSAASGFYKPIAENVFEKCLAAYTCVMPDKIDKDNFLPSSRSVAFTKKAWEKAGGYPENLDTCEDLVFDKKLKSAGFKFVFAKNAIVYWPQRKNIFQAFIQFFKYAKGDGKAFYIRSQTPFLYFRYFAVLLILFYYSQENFLLLYAFSSLGILYFLWAIGKNYKYVNQWQAVFILPILQITADIAVLLGTTIGLIDYAEKKIASGFSPDKNLY